MIETILIVKGVQVVVTHHWYNEKETTQTARSAVGSFLKGLGTDRYPKKIGICFDDMRIGNARDGYSVSGMVEGEETFFTTSKEDVERAITLRFAMPVVDWHGDTVKWFEGVENSFERSIIQGGELKVHPSEHNKAVLFLEEYCKEAGDLKLSFSRRKGREGRFILSLV